MPATSHFDSLGNFAMGGSEVSSDRICPWAEWLVPRTRS